MDAEKPKSKQDCGSSDVIEIGKVRQWEYEVGGRGAEVIQEYNAQSGFSSLLLLLLSILE